jgi:DNA adenine methylase
LSQLLNLFTWVGGKNKLAREIISIMPEHEHYIEVFFGSGVIFFNKPRTPMNTVNDFDGNLTNLFTQVRDNREELKDKVYWTLFSRAEHVKWLNHLNNNFKDVSDIDRALGYLFLILSSYQNMVGSGFTPSVKRNTADQFNRDLLAKIDEVGNALQSVVIENASFSDIIPKYNSSECLIYCDPPYFGTSDSDMYVKNFSKERLIDIDDGRKMNQHEYLYYFLMKSKSKWMVSYDSAPAIIDLYKEYEQIRLKTNYNQQGKEKKVEELLILNFKHKHPQIDIFSKPEVETEQITDDEKKQSEFIASLQREQRAEKEAEELRKELKNGSKPNRKDSGSIIQDVLFGK